MEVSTATLALIQQVKANPSGIWERPDGRLFQGVLVTNVTESTEEFPTSIVYQDIVTQEVFSWPLEKFLAAFTSRFDLAVPTELH